MNIALVFAGGTGIRMNSKSLPKQFLEFMGKPLIIYTFDRFDKHPQIDAIAVVCLSGWEEELKRQIQRWQIKKVKWVVHGGDTSQESIYNGLRELESAEGIDEDIVLIHDGVRPIIDTDIISDNINCVIKHGNCITVAREHETFIQIGQDNCIDYVGNRRSMRVAKAPQSFYFKDIWEMHKKAKKDKINTFIDSASMMFYYGKKLYTTECDSKNIKVTTVADYYIFKSLYEFSENEQILGV